jgi:undecaprenyl diphosphate synthase
MFFKRKESKRIEIRKGRAIQYPKPKHIAIDIEGITQWASRHETEKEKAYTQSFDNILDIIQYQIEQNIPVFTFFLMSPQMRGTPQGDALLNALIEFFNGDETQELFTKHKVKITILGKWYDLPQEVVQSIRSIADKTNDFDSFFVNFCLNYDGQEEIVAACKLICRQVTMGKLDSNLIKKETIKEQLYSSYFIPPDVIIRNGLKRVTSSLLLWDSPGSRILFTDTLFPDVTAEDVKMLVGQDI